MPDKLDGPAPDLPVLRGISKAMGMEDAEAIQLSRKFSRKRKGYISAHRMTNHEAFTNVQVFENSMNCLSLEFHGMDAGNAFAFPMTRKVDRDHPEFSRKDFGKMGPDLL
jgi:hypothetical protein